MPAQVAKVVGARIHPVKLSAPEPIEDILRKVQTMMSGNPPPWLRKALRDGEAGDERFIDDDN